MYYTIEDLQKLIDSLSGAEKRYFKTSSKAFSAEGEYPKYLQLYDHMASGQTQYREMDLTLRGNVQTTAKRQLFLNILKSLRDFHQKKSPEIIIQNSISEIEILCHLNLPDQSMGILRKALKLADEKEKFGLVLQILEWERRLNLVSSTGGRSNAEVKKEEHLVLSKLTQIKELESIYIQAKELKKQYGYVKGLMKKNLIKETIRAKGMPAKSECLSQKALYYFHFIHALYYWMIFDHSNAFLYSKELLAVENQVVLPSEYIDGILEHVTSCVCLGKFEDALQGLEMASAYAEEHGLNQSNSFKVKFFYYQVSYQIIIFNYTGNRSRLLQTIKDAEMKLTQYGTQLSFESRQVIHANLMNAYLGVGNIKKVDELWNQLFRRKSKSVRRDIYDDLYFFRLFNLLQSKTYVLIPAMASSAYRYYKRIKDHEHLFEPELKIATLLQKEHHFDRSEIRMEVFEEIKLILQQYLNGLKGLDNFQEHYTLYFIWIESLISERPFQELAAKWYKQYKIRTK
ncbi:hypothetical protein [Pedobacter nutrimenti]|uniref:hypothetical protein n=1 Tax=Pedobacter nutrimenti TaxID=1241337 RepID=UPI00292CB75D|nr:hypothetical protein [Pedobacter nutrimenti]